MAKTDKIEISHKTIIFTVFFLIGLYLIYLLKELLVGLFIAFLITTALNPIVTKLEKYRIPRPLGILSMYIVIISFLVFSIGTIVPPLVSQTENLLNTLPVESISRRFDSIELNLENIELLTNQLGSVTPVVKIVTGTFSALVTFFTFMVITFYMLMERGHIHKHLVFMFGENGTEKKAEKFFNKVDRQIGGWVRGEIMLMTIVGIITYIGLLMLQIPYALPLAIIAGVLEIVPNIGPTIAAVPAVGVAFLATQNPLLALFVVALYILVQQLENNFIVPQVMQSAIGVHPLVTIILIIIGLKLIGIMGAVLAVPIFLVSKVIFEEFFLKKSRS